MITNKFIFEERGRNNLKSLRVERRKDYEGKALLEINLHVILNLFLFSWLTGNGNHICH